jgi:cellulose synthase/poly-beta-1,6-N-acetylglucosamine synthase-like glycosyltransferase
MSERLPKISIVIPTYNAEMTIGPLLDSLLKLDYPDYEIIVVNDGSEDGTKAIVGQYQVKLLNQANRGASAARDVGLRAATGEIVAYVDSDVAVTQDWLRRLVEPFQDSHIGATTGRTVFLRNEMCTSWVRSMDIERRNAGRKEYTRLANGPNSAFRKSVLLEVGGFDPHWYHAEDTEVSYLVWRQGYKIRYVPEAVVHHVPEEDWRNFLRKRYRDAKAFTRMLAKYPRTSIFQDDFVGLEMKIQPPLFLMTILVGASSIIWILVPWGRIAFAAFCVLLVADVLLNISEAASLWAASRKASFFLKGLVLQTLRGFAWGLGLGVGGIKQVVPESRAGHY